MANSNVDKYTERFSSELYDFLIFLDKLVPQERTQQIIGKYEKLSIIKIAGRYNKIITQRKDLISKRDQSIFEKPFFIIPEVDLSFYWNNIPNTHHKIIWDTLTKLLICSNIILGEHPHVNEQHQQNVKTVSTKTDVDLIAGVGCDNQQISTDTIAEDIDANKLAGNPMFNMIKDKLNMDEITEKLKTTDKQSITDMTDNFKKIISPNIEDPAVSGLIGDMITDIGDELKNTDLTNGDLFGNLMHIAEKMSTKVSSNPNMKNCTPDKLLASTNSIMKSMGMPDGFNLMSMMNGDPSVLTNMMGSLGNSDQIKDIVGMMNNANKKQK